MNKSTLCDHNLFVCLCLLLLNFFISSNALASEEITAKQATQAIETASLLRTKSQQLGFEWSTVKPLITQAKQASKKGNYRLAFSLADQAIQHATLSIKQAEYAEKNWKQAVPK